MTTLCMGLVSASAGAVTRADTDPIKLYGDEIAFDVFRKSQRTGTHVVQFSRRQQDLLVKSRLDLSIEFLSFTVYRFRYQSEATWRAGAVKTIDVAVDDNGDKFQLEANRLGDVTEIRSDAGRTEFSGPLFPTNHWNANVIDASRVLNTLTGKVNAVRIESRGQERVTTERGEVEATRYAYTGELKTEVWYDERGRWVKMRFAGKDGVPIEYVCRRCQGPSSDTSPK